MPPKKQPDKGIPGEFVALYIFITLVISSLINITPEPFDTWFSVFMLGLAFKGVPSIVVILIIEYLRRR